MKKLIETLVGIPSACGHEQDVIRYLRDYLCEKLIRGKLMVSET